MRHNRFARCSLGLFIAAAFSYAFLIGGRETTAAYAQDAGTTAGQLTLLNKKGVPTALCPLKHTAVTADISGYCSRVTVRQDFANPSKEPVEAVYTFPLPSDAAVDDMTMTIGRRVIKGEIKRREEARQIYEAAKAGGQAAALLDQERPNIFTQSVANLMPGERISITISYVQMLKYDDGQYEFTFPMVVGPRFVPGGGNVEPGKRGVNSAQASQAVADGSANTVVTDAAKITPPITPKGTRAGHDISVTVNLDAGIPLTDVRSQLHPIRVDRKSQTRAVVRLENRNEIPNKDFILRYKAAGSAVQEGLLAYADGNSKSGYFTLILQPPAAPEQEEISRKEMVFVIDQTGSQAGAPIAKAKETMRYCIQNLNPGDTFQLLGFNTQVFPCFPAPVEANPQTIAQALKFLEPIEGQGGTDILKAVDYALQIPDDPDRLRIVCYLTDGYVGNDMQIIDYIKKNRGRARMFPCGVGNSINRFLIEGMAREGRGVAEIIDLNASGEAVASKFYKRVAQPLLLDIQVDWNGLPVEDVYPRQIPDLFSSGPIILKGRYTDAAEGDITVRGLLRGKPWSRTVRVALPARKNDGAALATVWARERIEDLQSQDWLGVQSGKTDPTITEQIINTALEYRLMSQHTSFVAVEQKVVNVGGKQRTVDVPVEMPDGVSYDGIFGESETLARTKSRSLSLGRRVLSAGATASRARGANVYSFGAQPAQSPSGGFGGGGLGGASAPALNKAALPRAGTGKVKTESLASSVQLRQELRERDVNGRLDNNVLYLLSDAPAEAEKKIAKLKPAEQKAVREQLKLQLRAVKLHKTLVASVEKSSKAPLEVMVWVQSMPASGLAKLKALGFTTSATLTPGRLILGTIRADRLDTLIALPWVKYVEPPKFK